MYLIDVMAIAISKPEEEEDTSDDSGCEYLPNGMLHEPRLYIFFRYSKS